jgi:anion-transporting  ArsA/GET3 family ATPase
VLGKGGVGKTTLSGAIGTLAANSGQPTIVMETDTRAPLAAILGAKISFEPIQIAPNFSLMVLEGRHSLEEYLRIVVPGGMLLKAVFASRFYQFFVQTAPGLRELMMLGKVYYESEQKSADPQHRKFIVVDAPASGQAISLLKMPSAARATFGESIVGKEANNIAAMLRDPAHCAILQVTTADGLSVLETIETYAELKKTDLAPGAVLFNRVSRPGFTAEDIERLSLRRAPPARRKYREHLQEIARTQLENYAATRKAIAQIRNATGAPVIEIPEHRGASGKPLIDLLAKDLSAIAHSGSDLHAEVTPDPR